MVLALLLGFDLVSSKFHKKFNELVLLIHHTPPARVWRSTWLETSQGPPFTSNVDTLSSGGTVPTKEGRDKLDVWLVPAFRVSPRPPVWRLSLRSMVPLLRGAPLGV